MVEVAVLRKLAVVVGDGGSGESSRTVSTTDLRALWLNVLATMKVSALSQGQTT